MFEPTEKDRRTVYTMSSYGIPQQVIAKVIGIHQETLRLRFGHELEVADAETTAKVAEALFINATTHMNVTAQIFWMKVRGRWRCAGDGDAPAEPQKLVITGGLPT